MSRAITQSGVRVPEQAHRRVLLLCIGALILFSTSPVFGHHLLKRADSLLIGYDHIGGICLIALHMLLSPVHMTFHVLLWAGIAFAMWDRGRAWLSLRRTLRVLNSAHPSVDDPLSILARSAGLAPNRISVVSGLPNPVFTTGFWRPEVFIDACIGDSLDDSQLKAVLAHEAAHVSRRDPLRLSITRFLAHMLFYVPAIRRLADDLADEAEIDADDAALKSADPLVLASAILALAEWPGRDRFTRGAFRHATVVSFLSFGALRRADLLERRVRRLAGEHGPAGTHVTKYSLGGAGVVLAAVWISGLMMAHPLPAEERAAGSMYSHRNGPISHCRHPGSFAFTHLFCLGDHRRSTAAPCPHTGQ